MAISDNPNVQPDSITYGEYVASLKVAEEYSLGWFAVVDIEPQPENGPMPCLGTGNSKPAAIADAYTVAKKVIGGLKDL